MDVYTVLSIILLVVGAEVFLLYLFLQYRKGVIEQNPLSTVLYKEWKIIYFALGKWRIPQNLSSSNRYLIHKQSSYWWVFLALVHEQILEMFAFHIYLKREDPAIAYAFTGLHLYSILYLIGDYNWVRHTPVHLTRDEVRIKMGPRREIEFKVNQIAQINPARLQFKNDGSIVYEKNVFHLTAFPRILTRIFGFGDELKYEVVFTELV